MAPTHVLEASPQTVAGRAAEVAEQGNPAEEVAPRSVVEQAGAERIVRSGEQEKTEAFLPCWIPRSELP